MPNVLVAEAPLQTPLGSLRCSPTPIIVGFEKKLRSGGCFCDSGGGCASMAQGGRLVGITSRSQEVSDEDMIILLTSSSVDGAKDESAGNLHSKSVCWTMMDCRDTFRRAIVIAHHNNHPCGASGSGCFIRSCRTGLDLLSSSSTRHQHGLHANVVI